MSFFSRCVTGSLVFGCLLVGTADAQVVCPRENGQIGVYFDAAGTQPSTQSVDPLGGPVIMWVYGEGFCPSAASVRYGVDYGPNLAWQADLDLPPVFIGSSPTGISIGLGFPTQPGTKFLLHRVFATWTVDDCTQNGHNVDGPVVVGHPDFPDPCPTTACFPFAPETPVFGVRSQTCQLVELDIKPNSCPNPFNINRWDFLTSGKPRKGGVLPVAILGSSTVDVTQIDLSTVRLEGVALLSHGQLLGDVETEDGDNDCVCDGTGGADGFMDQLLKFDQQDIAAAIPQPAVGDVVALTLTGAYFDGLPFEATDCITIVGGDNSAKTGLSNDAVAGLGFPSPNPFNPVTRISYTVPSTQHVRIAVYDVAGRLVDDLVDEVKGAGEYVVEWDAGRLPSGVYFYRMQTGGETLVRRATLLK